MTPVLKVNIDPGDKKSFLLANQIRDYTNDKSVGQSVQDFIEKILRNAFKY